jgi:hypothetical protein
MIPHYLWGPPVELRAIFRASAGVIPPKFMIGRSLLLAQRMQRERCVVNAILS